MILQDSAFNVLGGVYDDGVHSTTIEVERPREISETIGLICHALGLQPGAESFCIRDDDALKRAVFHLDCS